MKKKIYTQQYRPFIMGGDVNKPVACEVETTAGPFKLGGGYEGYLIVAPDGSMFVAEAETGALIGPSIKAVKADIAAADPEVMKEQIAQARIDAARARVVEPAEFWNMRRLDKGKER